ncbi:MAG: homoserine O-succinyltransferase [Clostridia bacterium]|jgi:homoserine O-succinyltransferase|nr:homoserine O-succinyltransferase [Clostridia bacterium]
MPVKVPLSLPAAKRLAGENIFIMDSARASTQEIRPLRIAVLNLMPNKLDAETQWLRLLSNNPLQVEVVLLKTASYNPKTAAAEHLETFYRTFDEVKSAGMKFDGLIVTGAPVEKLDYQDVAYWEELKGIMAWAEHHVYSSMYICWAAQAAMYYLYGIEKRVLPEKIFGIFTQCVPDKRNPLVRGFDDEFAAPHSRYTQIDADAVRACDRVDILAESDEAGIYLAADKTLRKVFVFGHGEYDAETLHNEYMRDLKNGEDIMPPAHYYVNGVTGALPPLSWRAHQSLLVSNWLNYCVYQATPYDIETIR